MSLRDLKEVHEIEVLSFSNPWTKGLFFAELQNPLSHPYTVKLIRNNKDIVVGYTIFWVVSDEAHLLNIAVHPDYRGQGIGRKLIDFVIHTSDELGLRGIFLEVRRSNKAARNLYERVGFEYIGVRKGYYSDNKEDAMLMALSLRDSSIEDGSEAHYS